MNRIVTAVCIILLLTVFISFHTYKIFALDRDVNEICSEIDKAFDSDDWDSILYHLDELQKRWDDNRFWACLTIETAKIEEIEISLRQSTEYAKLRDKEDFIGEFIMFKMLVRHLPHQEGFSAEELL